MTIKNIMAAITTIENTVQSTMINIMFRDGCVSGPWFSCSADSVQKKKSQHYSTALRKQTCL